MTLGFRSHDVWGQRAHSHAASPAGSLAILTVAEGPDGTITAGYRFLPTRMVVHEVEPWPWREMGGTGTSQPAPTTTAPSATSP